MRTNTQRALYENPEIWGKELPQTVLERARLTVRAVPNDVKTILEVGSGDGLLIRALRAAGYDPVGLDWSRTALEYSKNRKVVQGEAGNLPFSSNSFDLVLACELLEHLPNSVLNSVSEEISRLAKKYVIITVPYQEKLEWNYARCPKCGCVFNGAYHVRSFEENDIRLLFRGLRCVSLRGIVHILNPDRTNGLELFIRHHLASEYLFHSASIRCPLCLSHLGKPPRRNLIGWFAAGLRYSYRLAFRRKRPMWYLAVYEKY